jgi:hypothetical protein
VSARSSGQILNPTHVESGSDSNLYTDFDKIKHVEMQRQAIYADECFFLEKSLHILEDVASGVQVGDLQQVIVETFV